MWKASVKDIGGEVLCVSQFTLMASTSKGSKPDFHRAMVCRVFTPGEIFMITLLLAFQGSESSSELYSVFLGKMREAYTPDKIKGSSREVPCAFLLFVFCFLSWDMPFSVNNSCARSRETPFVVLFPVRRKVWSYDERLTYKRGAPMVLPQHLPAVLRVLGIFNSTLNE